MTRAAKTAHEKHKAKRRAQAAKRRERAARSRSGNARNALAGRSATEAAGPRATSIAPAARVAGSVIVHALGNVAGRHFCGGVTTDARAQPSPIRNLDMPNRLAAYTEILAELDAVREMLAGAAGGILTIEICKGCRYNAESGKIGAERALAVRSGDSAASAEPDFANEEDT